MGERRLGSAPWAFSGNFGVIGVDETWPSPPRSRRRGRGRRLNLSRPVRGASEGAGVKIAPHVRSHGSRQDVVTVAFAPTSHSSPGSPSSPPEAAPVRASMGWDSALHSLPVHLEPCSPPFGHTHVQAGGKSVNLRPLFTRNGRTSTFDLRSRSAGRPSSAPFGGTVGSE